MDRKCVTQKALAALLLLLAKWSLLVHGELMVTSGTPSQHFSALLCQKPALSQASLFVVSFPFFSVTVGLLVVLSVLGKQSEALVCQVS